MKRLAFILSLLALPLMVLADDDVKHVDAKEAAALVAAGKVTVLDVREPHEWQICHIEGAELLPLSELPARVHELDSSRTYYVHCKSGVRSARAIEFLQEAGFTRLRNVRGGIKAWAEEVDRSMPTY